MNQRTIPGTKPEMMDAMFWIDKISDPDQVILTPDEINQYNHEIVNETEAMTDIFTFGQEIQGTQLKHLIGKYRLPMVVRYDLAGRAIKTGDEIYREMDQNRNMDAIEQVCRIRYGIAVRNAILRSFPTDIGLFKEPTDKEFDRLQESECQAFEPVVVLHQSIDKKWLFVRINNYAGWARAEDIAIADNMNTVKAYVECPAFIVVTGNWVTTQFNHKDQRVSKKNFYMGTRIPLASQQGQGTEVNGQETAGNYVVHLAVRSENGMLEFQNALISGFEDVCEGYLPYSHRSILQQAFKLQGDRYDWGNKNNGRDCSSFVMYVYKTMGLKLPRNADEQETIPGIRVVVTGMLADEKTIAFEKMMPGAGIFMDGHVMMYIGDENGEKFMIHDFNAYGHKVNGVLIKHLNNQVAVTSTLLPMANCSGETYLDKFDSLLQFVSIQ